MFKGICREQSVAIKEMKMDASCTEHLKEFQREIAALIKLKGHENLIQLVGISQNE